jgi:hypothetical protein
MALLYKSSLFSSYFAENIIDTLINLLKSFRGISDQKLISLNLDIELNKKKQSSLTENKHVQNELKLNKYRK